MAAAEIVVKYEYEATQEDEVSVVAGQLGYLLERLSKDWWMVEFNGKRGLLPSPYIYTVIGFAKAEFDYSPQDETELEFQKGDEIRILEKIHEDWWIGHLNGAHGMFPSNFVRLIDESARGGAGDAGAAAAEQAAQQERDLLAEKQREREERKRKKQEEAKRQADAVMNARKKMNSSKGATAFGGVKTGAGARTGAKAGARAGAGAGTGAGSGATQKEINLLQKELEKSRKDAARMEEKYESLRKARETDSERFSELQLKNTSLNQEVNKLQAQITKMTHEMANLREEVKSAQESSVDLSALVLSGTLNLSINGTTRVLQVGDTSVGTTTKKPSNVDRPRPSKRPPSRGTGGARAGRPAPKDAMNSSFKKPSAPKSRKQGVAANGCSGFVSNVFKPEFCRVCRMKKDAH